MLSLTRDLQFSFKIDEIRITLFEIWRRIQFIEVRRPVKKSSMQWLPRRRPVKRQVEKVERPVSRKTSDYDRKVGKVKEPRVTMDDVDHLAGVREAVKSVSVCRRSSFGGVIDSYISNTIEER